MHVPGVLRMSHMKAYRMAIDLIRTCRDSLRDHLPRQRNPFTSGPGTSAKQKLMPVLLDRYFLTGMESKTTKEDNNSKCSAILSPSRSMWFWWVECNADREREGLGPRAHLLPAVFPY